MTYDEFKFSLFDMIMFSSRTNIMKFLTTLSNQFNIPLDKVVEDFNEYTMNSSTIGCDDN